MDNNETPIGYKAVANKPYSYGCEFCTFNLSDSGVCYITDSGGVHGDCSAEYRKDNTDVHFIKREN